MPKKRDKKVETKEAPAVETLETETPAADASGTLEKLEAVLDGEPETPKDGMAEEAVASEEAAETVLETAEAEADVPPAAETKRDRTPIRTEARRAKYAPSEAPAESAPDYANLPDGSKRAIALAALVMVALIVALYFGLNLVKKDVPAPSGLMGTQATMDPTADKPVASVPADPNRAVKEGDTVAVDYVGKLEDGTVFDTSVKSIAEKTPEYNPSRDYSPLLFTVGAGQMIKGFDKGVVGMKVGEKRTLRIPPEEAYGTGGRRETVDSESFKDKFVVKDIERKKFLDTVDIPVPASTFTSQGKPVPKVGETITAGGASAKVAKVEGDTLTLTIENRNNPFYGKELKVGLEAENEGNGLKIVKLTDTTVDVEVDNRLNPFYGKKLKPGLEAVAGGQRYTIVSINPSKNADEKETVTLEVAHKLAGKTLVFDVELEEIK